uniref:Uncharacterized protein n=1 Tax=Toxoplasma gondii TgCATBr9 TaxID=943120 RepID=A0A2T6IRS8_TOXGO|nr:hypothetical protein TGBR9_382610 [Toxoplasma gondii TgCATBr9]
MGDDGEEARDCSGKDSRAWGEQQTSDLENRGQAKANRFDFEVQPSSPPCLVLISVLSFPVCSAKEEERRVSPSSSTSRVSFSSPSLSPSFASAPPPSASSPAALSCSGSPSLTDSCELSMSTCLDSPLSSPKLTSFSLASSPFAPVFSARLASLRAAAKEQRDAGNSLACFALSVSSSPSPPSRKEGASSLFLSSLSVAVSLSPPAPR